MDSVREGWLASIVVAFWDEVVQIVCWRDHEWREKEVGGM
jgi:hypothetical protein